MPDEVMSGALLTLIALAMEACVGYPRALLIRIGHPVMWLGALLNALERRWNRPQWSDGTRRGCGVLTVLIVVGVAALAGHAVTRIAQIEFGFFVAALVASVGLAQRSLYCHVVDVRRALEAGDVAGARIAVARIVGRDTAQLNASEVAAAAIESLAESFNDAVVAPAFWLLIGGVPGLFAYKAINTADSMIGHKEERWRAFGWAAARLDDIVNLVPARLAGVLVTIAGAGGLRIMWRDAAKHASPNAGWPEAAMAGALAIRLGGPAYYDGARYERPVFGDGPAARTADLRRALNVYVRACALLWSGCGMVAALLMTWVAR